MGLARYRVLALYQIFAFEDVDAAVLGFFIGEK
jgi:hypothetical protein